MPVPISHGIASRQGNDLVSARMICSFIAQGYAAGINVCLTASRPLTVKKLPMRQVAPGIHNHISINRGSACDVA
jgi:hypothetical protein